MTKVLSTLFVLFLVAYPCFSELKAQDNLRVEYENPASVPNFLNICGDTDTETVRISLNGSFPENVSNLNAAVNLFKGVDFISLDAAGTTPGVTLIPSGNSSRPEFSIPTLSASGTSFVLISFNIAASCEYIDTITANDMAIVQDRWDFTYDFGGTTGVTETDLNLEYRDAFAVPSFTIDIQNNHGPARVEDCFSRDLVVTNTGLDGFVDSIVYNNVQGRGIWVTEVLVNGVAFPVTKTTDLNGDTLITAIIDGTFFVNNTTGGGNPGNGNAFFDPDEEVTITENICVLNCTDPRTSNHSIEWGCNGRTCTVTSIPDFIRIGEGAANIIVLNSGSTPNQTGGYCQLGVSVITIINDGVEVDPGFATMMDVSVGIGLGNSTELTQTAFEITGMRIGTVDLPTFSFLNDLNDNPLFTTDPDGAGGLDDIDGDGFFDDLGQNDSLLVIAFYEYDCSLGQQLDESCANDISANFTANITHIDQCLDLQNRKEQNYFGPTNSQSNVENFTDADAFVVEDTFVVVHTATRGVFDFERDCGGNEQILVSVILPMGVTHMPSHTSLTQDDASLAFPLLSETISNDTLLLVFDASVANPIGGEFRLELGFLGDCTANLGPIVFPTEFSHYCPSCDCEHLWWCGDLEGPTLHARFPNCPQNCPIGVQSTMFSVNRTTFGYTDNTYSTPFDPALANKKIALSCDSVEMKLLNIVGATPLNDSIGVVIHYNNIDGSMTTDETFLFDHGVLRVTNGGTEYICPVDPAKITRETIDSTQFLTFDLHDCLSDLGLTLVQNDTLEFIGNFSVNPDGPFETRFNTVPNLRGYGYGTIDGVEFACDNFGDNFTVGKSQTSFSPPTNNSFPEGCAETFLEYRLITVNNGFAEPENFGNEFRQAISIDSLKFEYDSSILDAFSVFQPQVSIPGHPIHGSAFFDMPAFESFEEGTYIVSFDTLNQVPSLNEVQSFSFNFRIRVVPNCQSIIGSANGDNLFEFESDIFFKDRFYASEIGDGSCIGEVIDSSSKVISYTEPPTFSFTPTTNPNFSLAGDTAVWEFQHCNTSFVSDAGLTWIALEQAGAVIEVVSIEDISISSSPVDLVFEQYGAVSDNYFAYTPGIVKADGTSPINDICNTIRVKALVKECGITNLVARVGWNCQAYDEPSWNPELYPPCEDMLIPISVTTLEPFLDANIITQPSTAPDICDTSTIEILLRNTSAGVAFDVVSQIVIPFEGMELVDGSFEIAYPHNAAFIPALADPDSVGISSRGTVYEYSDFSQLHTWLDQNGLSGFNASSLDSNQLVIRYKFTTNCDYQSGSISYYTFQGLKGCGDTTNFELGETLPIEINGADPTGNKSFDVNFTNTSSLIPGQSSTLEITVVNKSTDPTDANDKVNLLLPPGVSYDLGSTNVLLPSSWTTNTEAEIDTIVGAQNLYWCLPIGMAQNDTARFQFNLTSPDFDCSIQNFEVGLFTVSRTQLFCSTTSEFCDIEDITSTNNGQLTDLPVLQALLSIDLSGVTSFCQNGNAESVNISGAFGNPGIDFPASNFTVRYFYDVNDDGVVDGGDLEINSFTDSGPIASGGALPFNHTLTISASQACGLIAQLDTTGLGLCEIPETPLGEPQLLNAGSDQLFCEVTPTTIVTDLGDPACNNLTGYSYNWLAISPASTGDLSATNIADPVLTVAHNAVVEDTLMYILETTRPTCNSVTRDTVSIVRGLAVVINEPDTVYVLPGQSTPIGVLINNGTAPFTYNWSPSGTLDDATAAMPIATPTGDTDYMVTVTSATGCSEVATVVVINSNAIIGTITPGDTDICPGEELEILATGGSNYLWEADPTNPPGGMLTPLDSPNPTFSGGLENSVYNYHVLVTDPAFPSFVDTVTMEITVLDAPDIVITNNPPSTTCADEIVTLTASGADSYTWVALPSGNIQGTEATLDVTPNVTTTYQVYGPNALGCFDTTEITLNVFPTPIILTPITDLQNCVGDTIPVSIQLNEDISTYTITGGLFENDVVITNNTLTFNAIYTTNPTEFEVELEGASTGCTVTESFSINSCLCDPAELTSVTVIEPTCGTTDGFAMIKIEGDESNYNYNWTPDLGVSVGAGNIRDNIPAGGYTVELSLVGDPTCTTEVEIVVNNSDGPATTFTTTPASCAAADGTATFLPATFDYVWEVPGASGNTHTNLGVGTYFVTVTNPGFPDCPSIVQVEIEESNTLSAEIVVIQQPDCNMSNGSVLINVTGGSGNYSFDWAGGNGLSSGMHTVIITDNDGSGCELPFSFVLTDNVPAANMTVNAVNNITCDGNQDGEIDFSIAFEAGFAFPADTMILDANGDPFTNGNLPVGEYCVVITDNAGCVTGGTCFVIEQPDPITFLYIVEEACDGPGSIDLTVLGGTAPFQVDWQDVPGAINMEGRNNLAIGTYDLVVTDANGCTLNDDVAVGNNCPCEQPDVNSIVVVESVCGQTTGSANINLDQNEGGFEFTWTPDVGSIQGAGNIRTNLPWGGYSVSIIDTLDGQCSDEVFFVISNLDGPDATYTTMPATCAAADGFAQLNPTTFMYMWEDGTTDNSRNDLTAGTHFVTVTDPTNPDCQNVITVVIDEENGLMADAVIDVAANCGIDNGQATINVTGGSGTYTYVWNDGVITTNAMRTNLGSGVYTVTIRDNDPNTTCKTSVVFVMQDNVPGATITFTDTTHVSCFGSNNGSFNFSINYDGAFNGTPDTIITDGVNTFTNLDLAAGEYCIYIRDGAGCLAGSNCLTIEEPDPLEILITITPICEGNLGSMDVESFGGTAPYDYDWADLDDADDTEDRTNLAVGTYDLTVTDVMGCLVIEDAIFVPNCSVNECDYFFGIDSLITQAVSCGENFQVCMDIPLATLSNYVITVDGIDFTDTFDGCAWDTLVTYSYQNLFGQGDLGPYNITSWNVGGNDFTGAFQDIAALVDSMNAWVPSTMWELNTNAQVISGMTVGLTFGPMNVEATDFGANSVLTPDFTGIPNGLGIFVGTGIHEIIVHDSVINCSDTLYTTILCTTPDTIYTTIEIFDNDTICFNTSELLGPADTIFNACGNLDNVTFEFLGDTCVVLTGTSLGNDTTCFVICDEFGICDTTHVIIDVILPNDLLLDTICFNGSGLTCIDTSLLALSGDIVSMRSVCPSADPLVDFGIDPDNFCVSYRGINVGVDTACIQLCDAAGVCDTVSIYVTIDACSNMGPNFVVDTIYINETDTFCLDTLSLPGTIVSIENFCADDSGEFVDFFLDPNTWCVEYTGLEIGKDTACVVLCDDNGLCDTTFFCIFVEPFFDPPEATLDCDTTSLGTPVVIDVKGNDILFGGLDTAYILTPPRYGTATMNLDCSITYNPDDEFCERSDDFTYVVCTPNGCDTALTKVWIECVDIVIFTAVSANNDGVNDVFFIAGIEDFPDSELLVYNRWGNVVFRTIGYDNKWNGTWDGDKDLPDGTYYYFLKLNDEEDRSFRGYFELYR